MDGGAHSGVIIDIFLASYKSAQVWAIEANPHLVEGLNAKYASDKRIKVIHAALGSENRTMSFNIATNDGTSSLLRPNAAYHRYNGDKRTVVERVEVKMIRLDSIPGLKEVDILKLDIQGGELEALKGAGELLRNVKTVTPEISFVPKYEGQPLFGDIEIFMRAAGFRLLNLYDVWTWPDGQLTSGDALFLNSRFFKP